jgi:hypothetical protein
MTRAGDDHFGRLEHYLRAGSILSSVYGAHAPTTQPLPQKLADWPVFAAACLARAHYALESTQALCERRLDAAVLTRVLYEHVVMFAWVAIDPTEHLPRLLCSEIAERRKAINDLKSLGEDASHIESVGKLVAELDTFTKPESPVEPALPVPDLALHADRYWTARLETFDNGRASFRGLYPALYRNFSLYTHPTFAGLSDFVTLRGDVLLIGRPMPQSAHAVTLAPLLFAMALLIAGERLGWPPKEEVYAAFENEDEHE